jgi:putative hydrolase of the HAD superfamily
MKIKALIFDMDGTLYQNDNLNQAYSDAAYYTLAKFLQVSIREAKKIIITKREKLAKKLGYKPTYTYTLKTLGVSFDLWNKESINYIKPECFLKPDKKLKGLLNVLSKRFKLGLLTNNSDVQVEKTLNALGINNCFDYILSITESKKVKPDPSLFKTISKKLGVLPKECLALGDRYDIDLVPAKACGMKVLEVKKASDLYKLRKLEE